MRTLILLAMDEIAKEPQLFLDLDKAGISRKTQPGQLGFSWDESDHPREPAGSAKGGEFSKKEEPTVQKDAEETGGGSLGANPSSGRSKEQFYHDTYTGPRFTYGGQNRPLGYAAIPDGFLAGSQREHPSFRHGVVDYPHELTPEQLYSYELERLYSDSEAGGMSPEQLATAGAWIEDYKKEIPNMSREEKDMMVGVYRAHKEGPAALRTFLDENHATNYYADALATQLNLPKPASKAVTADANPSSGPPKKFTQETPAWQMGESAYLSVHNVHQPWIAEISPMQVGMMSERQKAKYQEKRAEEWGTAAKAKEEWHQAVVAAHDRGEFTTSTEGVHPEAKTAILHEGIRREKAAVENAADTLRQSNQITSPDQVNVGDRVYNLMRNQYGTVTSKKRGRLFVQPEGSTGFASQPFTGMAREFSWKNYNDLQAAAKEQAVRPTVVSGSVKKAVDRNPVLLLKAKAQPGQLGFGFDEAKHPREPAGSDRGGEFTKRPEPEYKGGAEPFKEAKEARQKPKILGINDDVTTCEACGKKNLKKTVVLDFGDGGEPKHYGSDCAAYAMLGSKSAKNCAKVDLEAKAVEYALHRMKETGDPNKVAEEIQGRIGYGRVGMSRGGLDVGDLHIREDGSIGEPVGPMMTADLLTRIQNMLRSGKYSQEQIADMRGATVSQVRSVARLLPKHEPLGGHMPSHVPVGSSPPVTETPGPTEEFRLSKGASLLVSLEPAADKPIATP